MNRRQFKKFMWFLYVDMKMKKLLNGPIVSGTLALTQRLTAIHMCKLHRYSYVNESTVHTHREKFLQIWLDHYNPHLFRRVDFTKCGDIVAR